MSLPHASSRDGVTTLEVRDDAFDPLDIMKLASEDWHLSEDEARAIDALIQQGKGKPPPAIKKLPMRDRQ